MAILTKREIWRRHPNRSKGPACWALTAEEHENAKRSLRELRTRVGSAKQLAAILKVSWSLIAHALGTGRISLNLVHRAAQLACVEIEVILRGGWPRPPEWVTCPVCKRRGRRRGRVLA